MKEVLRPSSQEMLLERFPLSSRAATEGAKAGATEDQNNQTYGISGTHSATVADPDPVETHEWIDALQAVITQQGLERARFLLDRLAELALRSPLHWRAPRISPYANSIEQHEQPVYPGDLSMEERLASTMRWNALAMVARANAADAELGGHIASYASAADLFEVGFNHFFRGADAPHGADLLYAQPHSAPGIYARAFLEGRLARKDLEHFRREISAQRAGARGLSSYPHPWLMPDFWQFPTGSMGIGPISAIYQARFLRYLQHRGLLDSGHGQRKVWGIFGDGEMDEPESMSALTLAARERLDNLIFVINCNLQRLDGPVRGNGRIIDELESLFSGAGWKVVKVIWGSDWDSLFAKDHGGELLKAFANTVDGQFQTYAAKDGAFNRRAFFGQHPALSDMVADLSDAQIDRLRRGGHDMVKIHAAYWHAVRHQEQPVVILAHTKKGFGMGQAGQGRMTTHSQKKMDEEALVAFRDRFHLPLSDKDARAMRLIEPGDDSPELRYLRERRRALGGALPSRRVVSRPLTVPDRTTWAAFAWAEAGREMSNTLAFVRMLGNLLKDRTLGPRLVPIVADEARTFGMAALFRQVGIYSSMGQRYEPEDIGSVLHYREARDGQILEEGISEAGALASWTAAATSYAVHGLPTLPFYIYYSVFGFQRVGDQIWAAADQRARGFLIGATSGRTTLSGEGLQHQDGSSHLVAATIPNCRAYDPAYAQELAIILEAGMRQMLEAEHDVFYYVTLTNEALAQQPIDDVEGVLRGMHLLRKVPARRPWGQRAVEADAPQTCTREGGPENAGGRAGHAASAASATGGPVRLLASGPMVHQALLAADILAACGIDSKVFSVTSWSMLAREGMRAEREERLGLAAVLPAESGGHHAPRTWLAQQLGRDAQVVIAVSDYVRAVPEQIRAYLPQPGAMTTLGTDGFGRSDTRAELRDFFEVDAYWIAHAALARMGCTDRLAAHANCVVDSAEGAQAIHANGVGGERGSATSDPREARPLAPWER
jgi:pyruvate dehydrogenase E1 component